MKLAATAFLALSAFSWADSPDFRAGAAKVNITPEGPIWLSGYAARTRPSEGIARPLYARALAIESPKGGRIVFVSTDLIGLPRSITDAVSAALQRKFRLDRAELVFNSSHTHTGPMLNRNLSVMEPEDAAERARIRTYSESLPARLEEVVRAALSELRPASLAFEYGKTGFAANRRVITPTGVTGGVNPNGPVDHRVPVLRVVQPNGKVLAILFGYACHNTTLTAEFHQISGDYAGEAAANLETGFPGSIALFFELCAGDQNPNPRSRSELIAEHGKSLSSEVSRVVRSVMSPVRGKIRGSFRLIELPFAPHTREQYVREAASEDKFKARRARGMLAKYDAREEPRSLSYPVQVVRFDQGFTLIALGGEVVVDYALWSYAKFPSERLMVAGYSNDVPCYIPSVRILQEGGYEAETSMIYYGQPGRFTEEVESRIQDAIAEGIARVRK
jgi:hypothetical protein